MIKKARHSDQIQCRLCLSPRQDMYVNQQCGHSFCSACLDRRNLAPNNVIRCFIPSCNSQIIFDDVEIYLLEQHYKEALYNKKVEIDMIQPIFREKKQESKNEQETTDPLIQRKIYQKNQLQNAKPFQIKTFDFIEQKPKESRECAVCLFNEPDHVAIPCGHIAICGHCLKKIKSKQHCIICQSRSQGYYKIHY